MASKGHSDSFNATLIRIHRVLNTSSYRDMTEGEKIVSLHNGVGCYDVVPSQHLIASALNITRTKVQRAIKASKEGRRIGVDGRPFSLNEADEEKLMEFVDERCGQGDASKYPSYKLLSAKVVVQMCSIVLI